MPLLVLVAMSASLFVGTVLVGHIPLMFKLSEKRLKDISVYGGGLLLGAALSIVIPEGIEAVYDATDKGSEHNSTWLALALLLGFLAMYLIDEMQTHPHTHVKPNKSPQTDNEDKVDRPTQFRRRTGIYTLPRRISSGYIPVECAPTSIPAPINGSNRLHPDRPASGLAVPNDTFSDGYDSSPDDHTVVQDDDEDEERPRMSRRRSSASAPSIHGSAGSKSLSTTIGLIAHSLADGISLGASSSASLSSSSGVSLDVVVFLAIIIHKAPAAFGLTSVLLGDGWSRSKIRQALIAFSLAAPIGAIACYFILGAIAKLGHGGGGGGESGSSLKWWTGMALLFSGGTFLFVAAQVTQEQNPSIEAEEENPSAKWKRVGLNIAGMVSPLALRLVAGHGH